MTGPIVKFFRLEGQQRRLLFQAISELARARRALSRKPFRELIDGLETHPGEVPGPVDNTNGASRAKDIGWAVRAASAYTPWKNSCLVQVLAARNMMQPRGIGGAIYVGATSGEADGFSAHAWLKHGETFITGEAGHDQYRILTTFTW